jgi:hypothetical protein
MERCADKLRSYVNKSLDESNVSNAQNVAIVSVSFARELNRLSGMPTEPKNDSPQDDKPQERKMGLVDFTIVRVRIERLILNPSAQVEKPTEKTYDSILGWALSEDDMKTVRDIRKAAGYWEAFKNTELSNE